MKVVVSWLREFVDIAAGPEELGQTLSMRGFELASIDSRRSAIDDGRSTIDDAVLDFEITANRPDALSVIGLAREAATAYSLPLRPPAATPLPITGAADVRVTLEAPDLCPRYAAAVAGVTVGPSPAWLADRLQAAGVRPINNVVDVTNYVLLELGQPMHAFDLEKLSGRELRIRRARKGERIITLDGTERALDPEVLVIADDEKPQAVAGIMGGGLSEVTGSTRTIVLESACFNPKSVRLAGKRLGLKTEASARFERGTDINAPVSGLERAVELLRATSAGSPQGGAIDLYPWPAPSREVALRRARIPRVLGQTVADADVERILRGLGFQHTPDERGWHVTVPTYRVDVWREVDLIEEVGRHHGYDRLPATFPALVSPTAAPDLRIERDRLVRRVLLAAGCSEALTFSFIEAALALQFADASKIVRIGNPLSAQFAVLRPSLLPGLLTAVAHNKNRARGDVCLFEIGAVVNRQGESRNVAVAWTGDAGAHWSGGLRPVDFFDVKGLVERLAEALQVEFTYEGFSIPDYVVRGRGASVNAGGRSVGTVGMLSPSVVSSAGIASAPRRDTQRGASATDEVYVAELNLDALAAMRSTEPLKVTPLPRYPSIARDISVVVDHSLPADAVRGTIRSAAPETLVSVREFDRYQGKGVPEGRISLSLRLTFRSTERTLTDAEVEGFMKTILDALKRAHDAVQR